MTLYIATSNPGKLRDFAAVVTQHISLMPLPTLNEIAPPPEDQLTFEGNARLKAIYYSRHAPGAIVIADDSGCEPRRLNTDPAAQASDAPTRTIAATESIAPCPVSASGPTSTISPTNPTTTPTSTIPRGRTPRGRAQSMMTTHSGTTATSSAASPEGTRC